MIIAEDNVRVEKCPEYITGTAQQNYLTAEHGILEAAKQGYSHWYIDGSLPGERPSDWTENRIAALRESISNIGVKPVYHGNFKAPLGSDVRELGGAALDYIKREVDLSSALGGAPVIVHGGGIVEPRLVIEARRLGLNTLIDNLGELVEYARERNVEIWLENLSNYTKFHPFYYICVAEDEYAEVLENVPGLKFFWTCLMPMLMTVTRLKSSNGCISMSLGCPSVTIKGSVIPTFHWEEEPWIIPG
ncbi:hypothetical protein PputUW4_04693 [Pseudomonas sp. UW4]|nr:hypothetical protein PputUW4_04693 [Pseudomonas sp. UW4]